MGSRLQRRDYICDLCLTGGALNEMNYSNPEYDKLINKAQNELANDPEAYAEAMQDAEKILLAEDYASSTNIPTC